MTQLENGQTFISPYQRAVFFDRDGVLNHLIKRDGKITSPKTVSEFKFMHGAIDAVAKVKKIGFKTYIVTNQPGVYEGTQTMDQLNELNRFVINALGIDGIECALDPTSTFYKPNSGMIEYFINNYRIERSSSYLIGDRWKDIVAGTLSGVQTIYVGDKYIPSEDFPTIYPNFTFANVHDACEFIVENNYNAKRQF